jgi:Zn-dependent M28 family amino/carboxypeptidase
MTRRLFALLAALAAVTAVLAAPVAADPNNNNSQKLRQAVTLAGVQQHLSALQAIADISGGNRFAGLPGHERSADYIAEELEAAGYDAQFWYFDYNAFVEDVTTQLRQVSPTPTSYINGIDFRIMTYSGGGNPTAPLAAPSGDARGCYAADYAGFPAGNIALVVRGTPAGFPGGSCSFRIKTDNAIAAGATGILVYNNVPGLLAGTLGDTGLSAIPAIGLTQALGQSLAAQLGSGPVTMSITSQTSQRALTTRNVMADLPGRNPENVVVVGAHLDSVNAGPGINDNGSGSAAILETAIQMAKVKPRNTVRFVWWSAEESGLIGSTRYVNSLSQAQLDAIALNLNFDMVGSPNYVRFVYDGDNSAFPVGTGSAAGPPGSGAIEAVFHEYFASQGLASAETPFSGRSDYGPFIAKGIPAGGLFTGAEGIKTAAQAATYGGTAGVAYDPCYHASCDTHANVNSTVLDQNADAIAHATIQWAQNTEVVNGEVGKGNFKPGPAGPANPDGTTSGEGGGLHEDHDLPVE